MLLCIGFRPGVYNILTAMFDKPNETVSVFMEYKL